MNGRRIAMMLMVLLALGVSAGLAASLHCDVGAGPIFNQQEADAKCPKTCASFGGWNNQWKTVIQNQLSVCGCKGNAVDIEAGPIFNQGQAEKICPTVAKGVNGAWNGQWKTTVEGKMSVCGTLTCGSK